MQPILNIAIRASRHASEYILQTIDKNDPKPTDAYANAKLINHLEEVLHQNLFDALKKANPNHYILSLGETLESVKEDSWQINQIHNPDHLLRKLPSSAFSVLHKHQGKAQNTLLVNPLNDTEYTATRGSGATLNGRRIRSSDVKSLDQALVTTNALKQFSDTSTRHGLSDFVSELAFNTKEVLASNCSALDIAMVAAGQLDAAVLVDVDFNEIEAALLIAQEAGLLTGNFKGMPFTKKESKLIIANPKLFKLLVQRLNSFETKF